jgi:hypothetical protein
VKRNNGPEPFRPEPTLDSARATSGRLAGIAIHFGRPLLQMQRTSRLDLEDEGVRRAENDARTLGPRIAEADQSGEAARRRPCARSPAQLRVESCGLSRVCVRSAVS